jgi:DNA-binding MarR family transcriptional regulator
LAKLEEEGLVTKAADGRKTVYAITDAGRTELAERESELTGIENDVTDSVRRLASEVRASVNDAMRTLRADLAAAARDVRTETREATRPRTGPGDGGSVSRLELQQAEAAITEFRANLRSELRVAVANGTTLSADTVAVLRTGLAELQEKVIASLR